MNGPEEECPAGLSSARHPARATANKRPSKGRSRLGSLQSERRRSPRSPDRWEASDQRRTGRRHLQEGGVSCVRDHFSREPFRNQGQALDLPWWLPRVHPPQTRTCQRRTFPVVSELPIERLMRATQVWVEQARRRASKFRPAVPLAASCARRRLT